jgi:hypothetical protein
MNQVSLSSENFDELMRSLSLLKDVCSDVDIRNGILRQRSNDHAIIFEIDFSSLLPDMNIAISDLKQKLDLFKCFAGQEIDVKVDTEDFSFSDQHSSITFKSPMLDMLDNKFIPEQEFSRLFSLSQEDIILNYDISKIITDRIRTISQGFNVNAIQVVFEGETAFISARTQSKDQFAKFVSGIRTDRELNYNSNLVVTPFVIDHDGDIKFIMYNVSDNLAIEEFVTSIGDCNIKVYGRSLLVEDE